MRRYKKLKLFVHAQDPGKRVFGFNKETKFFIRFGSDATDNYYEYESSLFITPSNATTPMEIWPMENDVDLNIQDFVDAKIRRDKNHPTQIVQRLKDEVFDPGILLKVFTSRDVQV